MQIVDAYFRAGADKVSIGSDAVLAAEAYWANSRRMLSIDTFSLFRKDRADYNRANI